MTGDSDFRVLKMTSNWQKMLNIAGTLSLKESNNVEYCWQQAMPKMHCYSLANLYLCSAFCVYMYSMYFEVPDSTSNEYLSIARFIVWYAVLQKSSKIRYTAVVTPWGTGLPNFILLFTTMLPFLKFKISKFWKLLRLD